MPNTVSEKEEQIAPLTKNNQLVSQSHRLAADQQIPMSTASSISAAPTMDYLASSRSLIQNKQPTMSRFLMSKHRTMPSTNQKEPVDSAPQHSKPMISPSIIRSEASTLPKIAPTRDKIIPQKRQLNEIFQQTTSQAPLHQQVKVIQSPNLDELQMHYPQYKARLNLNYRIGIEDYLKHPKTDTKNIEVRSDLCLKQQDEVEAYAAKDIRLQVVEIGLFKRKE
ncbi:hypothetical protein A0J61_09423 [Choanephora cucurbitarum]|uniref:Uncharacterized protein n=1 Tax=Choanephora cucurbitarum TaxID=101091 RepID=A0A1C7N0C0_9FUNG|nr:hypothetical protein A0J61_09423 [Choanephora cucurbitarum]